MKWGSAIIASAMLFATDFRIRTLARSSEVILSLKYLRLGFKRPSGIIGHGFLVVSRL